MPFSDQASTMSVRPDRPLTVKASFDRRSKRIDFDSARNCSYGLLRQKVERAFSLSAFSFYIAYKDDDGEVTEITCETDLTEAIHYFQAGVDDLPVSSAASILSGRSFGGRKITLRVDVSVEYDGPSLSDTSSLASMDEYKDRNGSEFSLSFESASHVELDDDAVTVSSRDVQSRVAASSAAYADAEVRFPEDPSSVFERLKHSGSNISGNSSNGTDRSAQWLRDQKERAMKSMIAAPSKAADSVSDGMSLSIDGDFDKESLGGDLELEKGNGGNYYYRYTSGSSSQSNEYNFDEPEAPEGPEVPLGQHDDHRVQDCRSPKIHWIASQQTIKTSPNRASGSASSNRPVSGPSVVSDPFSDAYVIDPSHIHPDIPAEVLQFIHDVHPQLPTKCTTCSKCNVILDSFRYVCSTCGEKDSVLREELEAQSAASFGKGKERDVQEFDPLSYPPPAHRSPSASVSSSSTSSSWSLIHDVGSILNKPLPPSPPPQPPQAPIANFLSRSPANSLAAISTSTGSATLIANHSPTMTVTRERGYELCDNCIESEGLLHAISCGPDAGEPSSPEDPHLTLSQLRRSAPKQKGHLRHAYVYKMWGPGEWKDVEHGDDGICSICKNSACYKCISCSKFSLCRSHYSQVHEIHPLHPFMLVPEKPLSSMQAEPDLIELTVPNDENQEEEPSMVHVGVKCYHCLMEIVGACFHCTICKAVDICSNCESAGLPGNLDAPDGAHNSSHILLKIPFPLKRQEVENASRLALHRWVTGDAENVQRLGIAPRRQRTNSQSSVDAVTVIGSGLSRSRMGGLVPQYDPLDHRIPCKGCGRNIFGTRYQCATCPSLPNAQYNLCDSCEIRSYKLHDPNHIFFKLPRPVDHPIEASTSIMPAIYLDPAGPSPTFYNPADPKAYLQNLYHKAAVCDHCVERIRGEWFRCVYCSKDLCDVCEGLDNHDDSHFFFVFKAPVDMQIFRILADLDNVPSGRPMLEYPVYDS